MIFGYNQDGRPREVQVWVEEGKLHLGIYKEIPTTEEAETLLICRDPSGAEELLDDLEQALADLIEL